VNNTNHSSINLINHTVLSVLQHSVATGDKRTLLSLGVNHDSVEKLEKLSHVGQHLLGRAIAPIIQIDNKALSLNIQHSINSEKENEYIIQIILADAPLSVLAVNFGMQLKDFNEQRSKLGMDTPKPGRPREPEINRAPQALIRALEKYILNHNESDIKEDTELLISLSDTYKLGIREILGYHVILLKELM
jgi:hypothetical protein